MYDFIIVGAGLGGLYCAKQLEHQKVLVLETQDHVGGRCVTTKHKREKAAWRVHTSHKRMMKLIDELNINMQPTRSSKVKKEIDTSLPPLAKRTKKGMTLFETSLLKHGINLTQKIDQNTGYMNISKSSTLPYTSPNGDYIVPKKGMQEIVDKLQSLLKSNVSIKLNARVAYIKFIKKSLQYMVYVFVRDTKSSNKFKQKIFVTKNVILNCQPIHIPDTNFNQTLLALKSCVATEPLTHVYVTLKKPLPPTYKVTTNLLGQIVSLSPKQLMISYSGGDLATFHYHYHMNHPEDYIKMLKKESSLEFDDVQVFHYKYGVGQWNPNPANESHQLMHKCAVIHPIKLPGLYLVNENISAKYQGWQEGTLEVAELVLKYINNQKKPNILTDMPKEYLIYDGRVLNVENWKHIHPGSQKAIENHLGEDITQIFNTIHATKSEPMQYILGFQVGFVN